MGDGVLVYFGYPQAHEDDAERAVRAGLIGALHWRWTKSFEDFFKCSTQLALRLNLIRGFTPLIRKLDRIGVSPGANPDLHRGYHARA
jgi:hypothetical protein